MKFDSQNLHKRLPISVVILTKNEEKTIGGAILSAQSDYTEVVVLDSFSNDRTVEYAKSFGARVVKKAFQGYANQRNFALHEMNKATEWVFFLDADERISSDLTAEIRLKFNELPKKTGMFYMRRMDFFEGRWIKYSSGYPTWFGRLCHAPSVQIRREINEEYHCLRSVEHFSEHLIHFPFIKGFSNWLDRHNLYSSLEAELKIKCKRVNLRLIFSHDSGLRRKGFKQIYMILPLRPLIGFLYLYLIRRGFLDGKSGFRYALLRSFYELMISIKVDEYLKLQSSNVEFPKDIS